MNTQVDKIAEAHESAQDKIIKEMVDNWAHRDTSMKCRTCMWFVLKDPSVQIGRCRRHAPTMSGYPVVFTHDWCGDHKLNEQRLP